MPCASSLFRLCIRVELTKVCHVRSLVYYGIDNAATQNSGDPEAIKMIKERFGMET